MKKIYKRVTAIALTAVMAFTTFQIREIPTEAGNLSGANLGEWDYGFEAELLGSSVSYLDEAFNVYQYTKPQNSDETGSKVGPVKPTDKDPNSNDGSGNMSYFTTEWYGSNSHGGLKPTSVPGGNNNGYTMLTYNNGDMVNFEAEYEFYAEAYMGLTFGGEAGKFQITQDGNNSNDTAAALCMEAKGGLCVYGAIDTNNVTVSEGVSAAPITGWTHPCANNTANLWVDGLTGTDTISVEGNLTKDSKTFTVCVKVQDGVLTVYEKNHADRVVSINLSENYQSGPVSLFHTNTNQGAFKSFRIRNNDKVEEKQWDDGFEAELFGTSVDYLDEVFDVYQYTKPQSSDETGSKVGPVKPTTTDPNSWEGRMSYFTTGHYGGYSRGGLKPTSVPGGDNNGYTMLTYNKGNMANFEAEYEFYGNAYMGLTFGGETGKFQITQDGDNSNDTAAALCMEANGGLCVYGAIDTNNVTVSEGVSAAPITTWTHPCASNTANVWVDGLTGTDKISDNEADLTETSETFTVCVKVQDGVLTVYEKNHADRVVSINLSENYQSGPVSLFHTNTQQGAFKSFYIRGNIAWDYNFTETAGNEPERYFTSYAIDPATGTTVEGALFDQWFRNEDAVNGQHWIFRWDCKNFMRPRHMGSANQYTLATLRGESVQNVEAMVEYATSWTHYGVMLAPKGQAADSNNGGVSVYVNGDGSIAISGAIDSSTAAWTGTGNVNCENENMVTGPARARYIQPTDNQSLDGEVRAKQNQTSYVLQVKVADGSVIASVKGCDGELSVKLASTYVGGAFSLFSTGCDQGGFIGCNVKKLEDTNPAEINASAVWELSDNYVTVALSSDVAASKLEGTITFDKTKYEYVTELLTEDDLHYNVNKTASVDEQTLKFSVIGNHAGKLVTYLFHQITPGALDVNEFHLEVSNAVSTTVLVRGDANNDKRVEAKDLVHYMRNTDIAQANMIEIENSSKMRQTLVGIGTEDYVLAGKKALFLGDSIAYGANDADKRSGWSGRMDALYGMNNKNVAVSGWMLADHKVKDNENNLVYQNGQKPIVQQLDNITLEEGGSYDYVILHGGVNDIWHSKDNLSCAISIGTVTSQEQTEGFDTTTVCGALEDLIVKAREKAPNAKIAYIINFDISDKIGDMNEYASRVKEVCVKWDVPYLDLHSNRDLNGMKFGTAGNGYTMDGVHPNLKGYDTLVRYIGPWMEELK